MLRWLRKFKPKQQSQEPVRAQDPRITPEAVDLDARKVVRRLRQSGFPAYVVGGAVRDLLLGVRPKDFDLVTSASPNEIRRLFRNSIIIGRRFQLVHIRFQGRKIIETATFRRHHGQDVEGHIRRDNVFGTEREDAFRRDFTLNALFYDPEANEIIDYTGGLADVKAGRIRCIGDPDERMVEDPVRILRAIKFSALFNLAIDEALEKSIRRHRATLRQCNSRRLQEEFIKIVKMAKLVPFYRRASELEFFDIFLPAFAHFRKKAPDYFVRTLEASDRYTTAWLSRGEPFSFTAAIFLLLWPLVEEKVRQMRELQKATRAVFNDFQGTFPLSKMEKLNLRPLFFIVERMEHFLTPEGRRKRGAAHRLFRFQEFTYALSLYREILRARGETEEAYQYWMNAYRTERRPAPRREVFRRAPEGAPPEAPPSESESSFSGPSN